MGKLLLLGSVNTNSGSSSSAFQFTNISGSYTDLLLYGSLRGTLSASIVSGTLRINNISSSSYNGQEIETAGASMGSSQITNTTFVTFNIPALIAPANIYSASTFYIPNYTNTNQNRILELETGVITSGMNTWSKGIGSWYMNANNNAITQIDVFVSSGNMEQYSTLYLYAINWTP